MRTIYQNTLLSACSTIGTVQLSADIFLHSFSVRCKSFPSHRQSEFWLKYFLMRWDWKFVSVEPLHNYKQFQ